MSVAIRYLNRELAGIFVVTLLMLLLVAVGGRFIGYLQEAAMGKFSGTTVLTIMAMRMPEFVQLVSPFAMYIALVLTFGRLYADQEMVVLQGAGASTPRFLGWVGVSLLTVTTLVAVLAWYVTPVSQQALTEFMVEQRAETEFEAVNPGIFHVYDRGKRVTYSQGTSADQRTLEGVFIAEHLADGREVAVWAESGTQRIEPDTGVRYLVLRNGRRYEGVLGTPDFRVVEFAELLQRLTVNDSRGRYEGVQYKIEAQSMMSLGDDLDSLGEWHWRLALPLFCLIGGVLGMGMSRVKPRQGRFTKVVPGMLMMLIYYLALLMNRTALVEGQLPAVLGLWLVHLIFGGIAIYLLTNLAKPGKA